jgi:hypothetical protein
MEAVLLKVAAGYPTAVGNFSAKRGLGVHPAGDQQSDAGQSLEARA